MVSVAPARRKASGQSRPSGLAARRCSSSHRMAGRSGSPPLQRHHAAALRGDRHAGQARAHLGRAREERAGGLAADVPEVAGVLLGPAQRQRVPPHRRHARAGHEVPAQVEGQRARSRAVVDGEDQVAAHAFGGL